MERLHIHVSVGQLAPSIRFYCMLFARELRDLGMQVETGDELDEVHGRLWQADAPVLDKGATTCCRTRSEKAWITDPQGIPWETFLTSGESAVYGDHADLGPVRTASPSRRSTEGGRAACRGSGPSA